MYYRIVCCLLILGAVNSLQAGEIYTSHDRHNRLGTIDPMTGVGTDVGSYGQDEPGYRLASTAFDTSGNLYSIALLPNNTGSQLLSVDRTTGMSNPIGPRGEIPLLGMEFSSDNTLYATRFVVPEIGLTGDPELFTVDTTTGALSAIGSTGVERSMDLAFDSTGTLWLVGGSEGGNKLYTIDTSTGAATLQTELSDASGEIDVAAGGLEIMGIMFDENDTLFATSLLPGPEPNPHTSPVYTVDTTSGFATLVGQSGLRLAHGGDYLVPEPSSAIITLGLLPLLAFRRRRGTCSCIRGASDCL